VCVHTGSPASLQLRLKVIKSIMWFTKLNISSMKINWYTLGDCSIRNEISEAAKHSLLIFFWLGRFSVQIYWLQALYRRVQLHVSKVVLYLGHYQLQLHFRWSWRIVQWSTQQHRRTARHSQQVPDTATTPYAALVSGSLRIFPCFTTFLRSTTILLFFQHLLNKRYHPPR
jgi:hypothetical protein